MSCTATFLLSMVMTINLCYEESEEGGYSLEERDKVYSLEFGGGRGDKIIISLGFLSSPLRAGECGTRL